ncbi:MAG: serine/threonine-protein phosphatase [Akkermansiaceae bacterium]|nr:serine/threonine-protein phosphatase [Armatimonadota bacterium]
MTYLYRSLLPTAIVQPLAPSYERERRIAESLQLLLRSHLRQTLPGLAVETFYEAALDEASIGGDSFDAFPLDGNRTALIVADASGKGLEAAERIAEVRFALREFLREHPDPCTALACLNDFVCASQNLGGRDSGTFVTMTLVILGNATGEMTCLCAGGEPPLVLRSRGTVKAVPVRGTAIGLYPGLSYKSAGVRLEAGDIVLLATDGVTEARHFSPGGGGPHGSQGSSFLGLEGLARLARKVCASGRSAPLLQIGRTIFEGARAFGGGAFRDDAYLLIARRETSGVFL